MSERIREFCKECSILLFNERSNDFKNTNNKLGPTLPPGAGRPVFCSECGPTFVNDEGECLSEVCKYKHGLLRIPLKPCPCGKTPDYIRSKVLYEEDSVVYGNCCETIENRESFPMGWSFLYNNEFNKEDSPDALKIMLLAWNNAPRTNNE